MPSIAFEIRIASKLIAQAFGVTWFEARRAYPSLSVQLGHEILHSFPSTSNQLDWMYRGCELLIGRMHLREPMHGNRNWDFPMLRSDGVMDNSTRM